MDKSDSVQVIFLKDRTSEILTSKCSGINLTYTENDELAVKIGNN